MTTRSGNVSRTILFDVNVPRQAAQFFPEHTVEFSDQRGWRELVDGDLLTLAEQAGFDVLLTADTNLRYQQNLTSRAISIVVLSTVVLSTNRWPILRRNPSLIVDAVDRASPGSYQEVIMPGARTRLSSQG